MAIRIDTNAAAQTAVGAAAYKMQERCRRRFCQLAAKYTLLNSQVAALAEFEDVDDYRRWKVGDCTLGSQSMRGPQLLMAVLDRLGTAFEDPVYRALWLHRPNSRFDGVPPLSFMLSGGISAIGEVAILLDPKVDFCSLSEGGSVGSASSFATEDAEEMHLPSEP